MENIFDKENIVLHILNTSSFVDEFNFDIKQTILWANTDDIKVINNITKKIKKGGNSAENDELDELDELDMLLNDNISKEQEIESIKELIVVSDIHIFPLDNIKAFKDKIFIETAIQPCLQHLCVYYKNIFIPIGYSLVNYSVNIKNITDLQLFEGLPVDQTMYINKENIIINALDNFVLLEHVYNKYGTTTFYLININDFINPFKGNIEQAIKDKYSLDLIYYSFIVIYWPQISIQAFSDIITDEQNMNTIYQHLYIDKKLTKLKYTKETKLMQINKKTKINYYIKTVILSNILNYINIKIDLRNVFDIIVLDDVMYASILYLSDNIIIKKTFNNSVVKHLTLYEKCLMFYIKIPKYRYDLQFVIKEDGSYYIKTKWFENEQKDLNNIYNIVYELVNSTINNINKLNNIKLQNITENTIKYSNITLGIILEKSITAIEFSEYKTNIKILVDSGILTNYMDNIKPDIINYVVLKGMFNYNIENYTNNTPDNNRFSYLYNENSKHRFETMLKYKILTITHRTNDLYIEVNHLEETETNTILFLVNVILSVINTNKKHIEQSFDSNKKLKILKETDPLLYNIPGEDNNYGRICQKQKQPSIVDSKTKDAIEFWNYTKKKPEFYKCMNNEYKYLGFIPNKHPDKYCLPCCYKLSQTDNITYNPCITDKIFVKEKKNIHTTRYILTYNKYIDIGRLSKLPEDSLEPLFYDSFSKQTTGIDDECLSEFGYYLYGTPQHTANTNNVGILFVLCHAHDKNILDMIDIIVQKINENKHLHTYILNYKHIFTSNIEDFISVIKNVFIDNVLSEYQYWNELMIFLSSTFLKINIITFVDNENLTEESNIVLKCENNLEESNNNILVVETKPGIYYPIYYLDLERYFGSLNVNKKIFMSNDTIMLKLYNIIGYYKKNKTMKHIEFSDILHACSGVYVLNKLYTNSNNKVYAIDIKTGNTSFYFPVVETLYKPPNIIIDFEYKDNFPSIETITEFIDVLNKANPNREPISYNTYILYNDKFIGFKYRELFYITKPFPKKSGSGIKYIKLLYHPFDVNTALVLHKKPIADYRVNNINKHMYEKYLYQLVIIELQRYYNNEQNTTIRNKLYSAISKDESINNILTGYKLDSSYIKKLIYLSKTNEKLINNSEIIEILENSYFSFDKITYNILKNMNIDELKVFMHEELNKITTDGTPNFNENFPNMLNNCGINSMYCNNGKLLLSNAKIPLFVELLSSDLKNPLKSSIFYNNVNNIVDMYKFTIRKNEQIKIIM